MKEFKVKINRRDINEIQENARHLRITDLEFLKGASYEDVHAAYALLSLHAFLVKRCCEPDFEVVLSE